MTSKFSPRPEANRSDRAVRYSEMGLNNTEIAKLLDCTKENVRQILARVGIHSPVCWEKNREKLEDKDERYISVQAV